MMKIRYTLTIILLLFISNTIIGQNIICGASRIDKYLPLIKGKKVGIVGNHTSIVQRGDATFIHLVDTLQSISQRQKKFTIANLFSPEHGFRGTADAGAKVSNSVDSATGIGIVSLYGKNKKPTVEQLSNIDIMLFDLQDVGCRFYTYISTLQYVMEACAEKGIPLVVLDRPNPNGHYVDGPVMEQEHCSFIGMRAGTPIVYGMTIGEYAKMIDSELTQRTKGYRLHVVPLKGYTHQSKYTPPVPPSPNLRTAQAIALYPSLCLLEGTSISVGRGTPYPFEVIGNDYKMDLRNDKVSNRFELKYLREMLNHSDSSTFFLKRGSFERLAGNSRLRQQLLNGISDEELRAEWAPGIEKFKAYRKQFLLYD